MAVRQPSPKVSAVSCGVGVRIEAVGAAAVAEVDDRDEETSSDRLFARGQPTGVVEVPADGGTTFVRGQI